MQHPTADLFTVSEAAEKLRVHPDTLREWIYSHRIPAFRLGARWRIKAADLEALLQPKIQAEG